MLRHDTAVAHDGYEAFRALQDRFVGLLHRALSNRWRTHCIAAGIEDARQSTFFLSAVAVTMYQPSLKLMK
jgi:hypothetical protein